MSATNETGGADLSALTSPIALTVTSAATGTNGISSTVNSAATSGDSDALFTQGLFNPTSGNAQYCGLEVNYTINQTGSASGIINGLKVDATVTALLGTHNLLLLRTGGVAMFTVLGSGVTTINGDTTVSAASGTRTFLTQNADTSNGLAQLGTQIGAGTSLLYLKSYGAAAGGSSLGFTNIGRNFLLGLGDIVIGTANSKFVAISTNVLERFRVTELGNILVGTSTEVASTKLRVLASQTVASASGAVWDGVDMIASTLTLSGAVNIATVTGVNANVFRQPTISAASALSVAAASTVYIADAPVGAGAGPATLTLKYSLWIDAGLPRIDSTTANGAVATAMTSVGPAGSHTTVQEWLTIDINGTTRFIPCF